MDSRDKLQAQCLPKWVTLFAPWRWIEHSRKRWAIIVILTAVAYAVSPLMIYPLANRLRLSMKVEIIEFLALAYLPIILCEEFCPAVYEFYDEQIEAIDETMTRNGWPP